MHKNHFLLAFDPLLYQKKIIKNHFLHIKSKSHICKNIFTHIPINMDNLHFPTGSKKTFDSLYYPSSNLIHFLLPILMLLTTTYMNNEPICTSSFKIPSLKPNINLDNDKDPVIQPHKHF
jgi:hypothetical protein